MKTKTLINIDAKPDEKLGFYINFFWQRLFPRLFASFSRKDAGVAKKNAYNAALRVISE